MMLAELAHQVEPFFPPSARKDLKTSVKVLAHALDYPDASTCPVEAYHLPLPILYKRLETFLVEQGKNSHTIRNTKNNLSRLFRLADHHHLLGLKSPTPEPTFPLGRWSYTPVRPEMSTLMVNGKPYNAKHSLPYNEWSAPLTDAYQAFYEWATMPYVSNRDARLRKRPITAGAYLTFFEQFFGYLVHTCHQSPETLSFDALFDFALLKSYITWHINEHAHRVTTWLHRQITMLLALCRQYRDLPDLRTDLLQLQKTLPKPQPLFDKTNAWVPLAELRRIGEALWPPANTPLTTKNVPSKKAALRATLSLILQLWTFIPYRARNICEMRLDDNLYRDPHGSWRIKFSGPQLKVSSRRGRMNVFDLPFPPQLVSRLETYLHVWRPVLVSPLTHNHLFMNLHGRPWVQGPLRTFVRVHVYRYTGKFFHPHIVRTIWATEWIKNSHGDFYTAAIMLNDKLETVIAKYTHLLDEDVAEKAYCLIEERNGHGK